MILENCSVTLHPQEPIEPGNWAVVLDLMTYVEVYTKECTIRILVIPDTTREEASKCFGLPL